MSTHILGQGRGQLEKPNPEHFQTMFANVRACQYLLAEELLKHLAEKLQVEPQMLWGNPHSVRNLVRWRYRVANFKWQTQLPCFLCKRPFVSDGPCRAEVKQLPCCMGDVHLKCYNNGCQQLSTLQLSPQCIRSEPWANGCDGLCIHAESSAACAGHEDEPTLWLHLTKVEE